MHLSVPELLEHIEKQGSNIEGITISGGEPLQQSEGLYQLVAEVRNRTALSILLFSGYTREEICRLPYGNAILTLIDVLIDGRYVTGLRQGYGLRGSSNQRIHLLTERYSLGQIQATPEAEIHIDSQGVITISGVGPPPIR